MDETRKEAQNKNAKMQLQVKHVYDNRVFARKIDVGNTVMMWNSRAQDKVKHGKFNALWLGPYLISNTHVEDSYYLQSLTKEFLELPVHGQFFKTYFS